MESTLGVSLPTSRPLVKRRLGDVVVDLGYADREDVESAVATAIAARRPVGQVMIDAGIVNPDQLARALAERNGLPYVNLNLFEVDRGAANLVSPLEARRYRAVPISFVDEQTLLVGTSNPANVVGRDDIAMATGYDVQLAVTSPEHLEHLINNLAQGSAKVQHALEESAEEAEEEERAPVVELLESASEAPVVQLVHSVIADAVERGASDIHFDPRDGDMRVRFRVDGVVIDSTTVPRKLVPGLVSRIKIMAELDIAERLLPQDGRISLTIDGRYVELRVATLPVMRGESVVMRILDKDRLVIELDRLGMYEDDRDTLRESINKIHGAVLVTGPTGAGKTTTLYAAMNELNSPERTMIAIEDPVEYELDGIKQVQVQAKRGLTFAAGLRSMIRSDPDVLMVGEIRDRETAQIAIESALTGHLVLSTLHTNDAPMAPARLIEMGIEPFLVASGIECVVAQRLARRLCEDCRVPAQYTAEEMAVNAFPSSGDVHAFEPGGCARCGGTGFRGRVGIYEVMRMTAEVRARILDRGSAMEIADAAMRGGMRPMREDGLAKVRMGVTSVPEVLRVLGT
jgi:type IV pilus assembly protein PilB